MITVSNLGMQVDVLEQPLTAELHTEIGNSDHFKLLTIMYYSQKRTGGTGLIAIVIQHNHNIFLHKCKGESACFRFI